MNQIPVTMSAAKMADIHKALDLASELDDFHTNVKAILFALANMDAFSMLPADKSFADNHNAGCALLDMVENHAERIANLKSSYGNRISSLRDTVAEMLPSASETAEEEA